VTGFVTGFFHLTFQGLSMLQHFISFNGRKIFPGVYIAHFTLHSTADEHLGFFHLWQLRSDAAMDIPIIVCIDKVGFWFCWPHIYECNCQLTW
jgi:hypothetical protein